MNRTATHYLILAALGGCFEPVPPGQCFAPDPEPNPPAGGGGPAKPPVVPPGNPPAGDPPAQPHAVFETAEALNKRLTQARKQLLKEHGFESEEELKASVERLAKADKDAKEAEKAKLSEIERAKQEKAEAEEKNKGLMSELEQTKLELHLTKLFTEKGIKNGEYAKFLVFSKLAQLGETEELDERAYLDEVLKDPTHAAALGIAAPAPPPTQGGPNTLPKPGGAPPPPPSNQQRQAVDFATMSKEEMANYKRTHGLP